MFIFFLKLQQRSLDKRLEAIANKPKPSVTASLHLKETYQEVNDAINIFKSRTKTIKDYMLSFVPLTEPFKIRMIAARRLSVLAKKITTAEHIVNINIITTKVDNRKKEAALLEQPKIFKSPLNRNPHQVNYPPHYDYSQNVNSVQSSCKI